MNFETLLQDIVDWAHRTWPGAEGLPGKPSWLTDDTEAAATPPGASAPQNDPWAVPAVPPADHGADPTAEPASGTVEHTGTVEPTGTVEVPPTV